MFNDGLYTTKLQKGELTSIILRDRHPTLNAAKEPFCTRSQMVSYRSQDGNEVVRIHQYLRKTGEIGASGKPDPKRIYTNGMGVDLVFTMVSTSYRHTAVGM